MTFDFPRTFGQDEAREKLRQTLAQGRFPHALLVHGEPGLGQHALLLDLAHILSCESADRRPCGACASCRLFESQSADNVQYLMPLVKKEKDREEGDESMDPAQLDELLERIQELYRNPHGFTCPDKAMVTVGQARHLISRLGYAENRGKARLVIVPYFEALNTSAANALLKVLEEPPAGVYFLIASEHRAALLPTLLSRCLHLGLAPLDPQAFRAAAELLSRRAGKSLSERLLPFAEGSPGVYLELLENDGEDLLEESLRFLSAVTSHDWRMLVEYTAEGPAAEGLEATVGLLHFLLRMLRAHRLLAARHARPSQAGGRDNGYRWTSEALRAENWDASLSAYLGPFEDVADLPAFAAYLEAAHQAVKGYSKPQVALLGLYLEYDAKVRKAARKEAA